MQLKIQERNLASSRSRSSIVHINEGQYYVKNITSSREKNIAHKLRHRVFSQELGWVPQTRNRLEYDEYDDKAVSFGVFDLHASLKAYLRVVMPQKQFMLEKEFPYLLHETHVVRKENDTVEISRLCVAPEARNEKFSGNFGAHSVSMMLYKGLYHWCLKNKVRYLYLVVEEKIWRLLCARGFPCKLVGDPRVMPDGVVAVAAMLDWREFEETGKIKRPNFYAWFRQNLSSPSRAQLPQREAGLPHQAFS